MTLRVNPVQETERARWTSWTCTVLWSIPNCTSSA